MSDDEYCEKVLEYENKLLEECEDDEEYKESVDFYQIPSLFLVSKVEGLIKMLEEKVIELNLRLSKIENAISRCQINDHQLMQNQNNNNFVINKRPGLVRPRK